MPLSKSPIKVILDQIIAIANGSCTITEEQIKNENDDNFREVMMGLLILSEDLDLGKQELEQINDNLEKTVASRTAELSEALDNIKINESKYSSFFENSSIGMLMISTDGYFDAVNEAVYKMLGYNYESQELIGVHYMSVTLNKDKSASETSFSEFLHHGLDRIQIEKRFLRKDGSHLWARTTISNIKDVDDNIVNIVVVLEGQTEKILIEKERDRLYNDSNDLICATDKNGYLVSFNPAFLSSLGHSEEELKAIRWLTFIHPDDVEKTVREGTKLIKGIGTYNFQHRFRCGDGSYKWLAWSGALDKITGQVFGIARDITYQVKNEQALQRTLDELKQFSYIATHDLKVPLDNIKGYYSIINDELEEQNKLVKEILPWIGKSVKQVDGIIASLINVAKAAQREEALLINWEEITSNLDGLFRQKVPQTAGTLTFDFSEVKELNYSKYQISSIFQNIISNALKYHSPERNPIVRVTATNSNEFLRIDFTDNGLGIDLEVQSEKLFGLFQRIYTNDEDGTGLGLYMIKKMIESRGRKIEVESEIGKGSTFSVFLLSNLYD